MEWTGPEQKSSRRPQSTPAVAREAEHKTPSSRPGLATIPINGRSEESDRAFEEHIRRLDVPSERDAATVALNKLMLNEHYHARVAADPKLFAKLYHRVKQPNVEAVKRASPAIAAKQQEIHSTYDQLHHILARTGTASSPARGRGLANDPEYKQPFGTENKSVMTAETARAVQFDAIAKLISLHAGGQVRMPAYTHRFGPLGVRRRTVPPRTCKPSSAPPIRAEPTSASPTQTAVPGRTSRPIATTTTGRTG